MSLSNMHLAEIDSLWPDGNSIYRCSVSPDHIQNLGFPLLHWIAMFVIKLLIHMAGVIDI